MQNRKPKVLPGIGILIAIALIGGSIVGGISLASQERPSTDDSQSTEPSSNEATTEQTPGEPTAAASAEPSAGANDPGTTTNSAPSSQPTRTKPSPKPRPSLTCWTGPGDPPPGVKPCEDDN